MTDTAQINELKAQLEDYANNPVMQQYAPVACDLIRRAIALLEEREGYVLVPEEPTEEMKKIFIQEYGSGLNILPIYKTMIAASHKEE